MAGCQITLPVYYAGRSADDDAPWLLAVGNGLSFPIALSAADAERMLTQFALTIEPRPCLRMITTAAQLFRYLRANRHKAASVFVNPSSDGCGEFPLSDFAEMARRQAEQERATRLN